MNREPISFYIPARNAEASLPACIDAVRAQTRPPDEFFVIVDPRSTDRTVELARLSGVRVVEQTGATLGATRNQAITTARHRWLASCDSDVIIDPEWLERLSARRSEGAAGIGGRTLERTRNPFDEWRSLHMPHHWGEHAFRNPFMLVSEVLFDRAALLSVGGYREDLNYYEDSDLCQRLREAGFDLLYEPGAVGVHQRSDDLPGLLGLRWKYSEYRQKHLLDRYAGLLEKCRVNREYALNTLARSLARGCEELAYISFLLFFHHLGMDFRSMLSRRPLIPAEHRAALERELLNAALAPVANVHPALAGRIQRDLPALGPGDCAQPTGVAWREHLVAVRAAAEGFTAELDAGMLAIVRASAEFCGGDRARQQVPRLPPSEPAWLRRQLDALPLRPFVDTVFIEQLRQHWPGLAGIRTAGAVCPAEQAVLAPLDAPDAGNDAALLAPHLEARPDPLNAFPEAAGHATRLVACYQAPARFIPGLDVATAADLAAAATAAGWQIERFDTLVGRTRLILSRPGATRHEAPAARRAAPTGV